MRSAFVRRGAALFGLAALFAVAIAATKPPAKGLTYRIRMSSQLPAFMAQMGGGDAGGPIVLARVKSIGSRARFDLQAFQPAPPGLSLDDYVLFLDSSRVYFVNPAEKSYVDGSALLGGGGGGLGMLGALAGGMGRRGRGGDAGGGMAPGMDIMGIVTDLEQLDGDTLDGRQVKHYRLVAEMSIAVMGQSPAPLRIVMEMWTANIPHKIVNPFDMGTTVAPNDPAAKLTTKLIELRKQIDGTVVKSVVTTTLSGLMNGALPPMEFVQTTAITEIKEADVDEKDLQLPAGFTKKSGPGSP
jgi:hypothetical protein